MSKQFVKITCPNSSSDATMFRDLINQGIDADLEAFTKSEFSFDGGRLVMNFHIDELDLLTKRLEALGTESALLWSSDIKELSQNETQSE